MKTKNISRIRLVAIAISFLFGTYSLNAQSVAKLREGYGTSKTAWNASTGVLTFKANGTIKLGGTQLMGNARKTGQNSIWDIPDNVNKIVINAGVQVNGQFYYQRNSNQAFKMVTIQGKNKTTSKVFGTNTQDFGTGKGADYITFLSKGKAGLTIKKLTSLNPKGWHSRNEPLGGAQMIINNCRFIDNRGGFANNSDGNHNANKITNCYFETGDDIFAQFANMTQTIKNCTVKLVQNAMPINFGYNGSTASAGTMNITNLVIEGNVGRNGPSLIQCHNRDGSSEKATKTININGLKYKPSNNNSKGALINADGTLTIKGTWTNVDINVKEYFFSGRQSEKPFGNAKTGNLKICGTTSNKKTYNCGTPPKAAEILVNPNALALEVYPNPASAHITLSSAQEGAAISVFNLQGKLVYSGLVESTNHRIETSSWGKGLYMIHIYNGISAQVLKVNIQ